MVESPLPSVVLLGVRINRIRVRELMQAVLMRVLDGRRSTVLYVNTHCMNIRARDSTYAGVLDAADIVYCDGTGVRLAARMAAKELPERMTGADWIHDLARLSVQHNLGLFLLGGEPGRATTAATVLRVRHPGLNIVGTASGYDLRPNTLTQLNSVRPDIVLVGMGTPRQEKWIAAHREEIDAPVVWAVGALFDFVSGTIPRGPRWMTEHGLEWVCRLSIEPRKLWRRYLLGNPAFFLRVARAYWLPGHTV